MARRPVPIPPVSATTVPGMRWRARTDRDDAEAARAVALEAIAPEAAKSWLLLRYASQGRALSVQKLASRMACGANLRSVTHSLLALHDLGLAFPVHGPPEPDQTTTKPDDGDDE